jgi:uncharacterized protein (TIGR03067 family)
MQAFSFLGLAACLAAPAIKDPPKLPSGERLVGKWECVDVSVGGRPVGMQFTGRTFEFKADGTLLITQPSHETQEKKHTASPRKNPPEIDIVLDTVAGSQKTGLGVYGVDKDVLTLCLCDDRDGKRPAAIKSERGTKNVLWTFKRVSDDVDNKT